MEVLEEQVELVWFYHVLIIMLPELLLIERAMNWIKYGMKVELVRMQWVDIFNSCIQVRLLVLLVLLLWLWLQMEMSLRSKEKESVLLHCQPLWALLLVFWVRTYWSIYWSLVSVVSSLAIMLSLISSLSILWFLTLNVLIKNVNLFKNIILKM